MGFIWKRLPLKKLTWDSSLKSAWWWYSCYALDFCQWFVSSLLSSAPFIGLFNLLNHYKAEQIPFAQSIREDFKGKYHLGRNRQVEFWEWSRLRHTPGLQSLHLLHTSRVGLFIFLFLFGPFRSRLYVESFEGRKDHPSPLRPQYNWSRMWTRYRLRDNTHTMI